MTLLPAWWLPGRIERYRTGALPARRIRIAWAATGSAVCQANNCRVYHAVHAFHAA